MTWLRENLTADGTVTTTDTWLLARLGAGYVTDAATASRTMLLGLGDAASAGEDVGAAEVETVVEPSITADQAAERASVFRSALDVTLAWR